MVTKEAHILDEQGQGVAFAITRLLIVGRPKSKKVARETLTSHGEGCRCNYCVSARYTQRNLGAIPNKRLPGGFEAGGVRDTRKFRLVDEKNDEE